MHRIFYIVIPLLLNSCEVQYAMVDGSIDADTYSVDIFEVQAANAPAGYGSIFTEFLRDFIVSRSKLKMVKENAEIEISGKVTSYFTTPVAVQSNEVAALNRLTISVKVSVINNKEEKQSFEKVFTQFSDYDSSNDLSTVEDQLLEDINEKISQDILNQLSSNW
jgi:hypothetical protein